MKYCAFLRGVNVNGTSIKMIDVCHVFAQAEMQEVTFVLATGNILFSSVLNPSLIKLKLEKALSNQFNYEAFLFLKTEPELVKIFKNNPFTKSEDFHIYNFIGIEGIADLLSHEFDNSKILEKEKGEIVEGNFFWQIAKGNTLDSAFGKVLGKKYFKEKMTSRNINTIEKIIKKF